MADPVIRMDRSKHFSECRGERTPDDPHYKVHFWQGFKNGKETVLLPFDAQDVLVPDDGRTEPYEGLVDGKPFMHNPLYTKAMRETIDKVKKRLAGAKNAVVEEEEDDAADGKPAGESAEDTVNFASWLRGEANYQPHELRKAAKARYHKNYQNLPAALVVDLVLDERVVPENQVCAKLAKYLPAKAA